MAERQREAPRGGLKRLTYLADRYVLPSVWPPTRLEVVAVNTWHPTMCCQPVQSLACVTSTLFPPDVLLSLEWLPVRARRAIKSASGGKTALWQ